MLKSLDFSIFAKANTNTTIEPIDGEGSLTLSKGKYRITRFAGAPNGLLKANIFSVASGFLNIVFDPNKASIHGISQNELIKISKSKWEKDLNADKVKNFEANINRWKMYIEISEDINMKSNQYGVDSEDISDIIKIYK